MTKEEILAQLELLGCAEQTCLFRPTRRNGMCTNSGCHCLHYLNMSSKERHTLTRVLTYYKKLVELLETEISASNKV